MHFMRFSQGWEPCGWRHGLGRRLRVAQPGGDFSGHLLRDKFRKNIEKCETNVTIYTKHVQKIKNL